MGVTTTFLRIALLSLIDMLSKYRIIYDKNIFVVSHGFRVEEVDFLHHCDKNVLCNESEVVAVPP